MRNTVSDASAERKHNAEMLARFTTPMPSVEERMAAGKALRAKVPHERHADYRPAPQRTDPVAILEEQAKTRLPALVPIRYARMLASPFAFLRGSAAVMAADLAHTPVTGLRVQACGDMHVANFGFFASAERNLVFGINDFDETLPGAWEWDLKRLAASAVVAARFMGARQGPVRGRSPRRGQELPQAHARIRRDGEPGCLVLAHRRAGHPGRFSRRRRGAIAERIIAKARERGHIQVLAKMAELVDDRHRIVEDGRSSSARRARRTAVRSGRRSPRPWTSTSTPSPTSASRSLPGTGSSTWPARSWAWGASAPAAGSSC